MYSSSASWWLQALSCEGFTPVHAAAAYGHKMALFQLVKNGGSMRGNSLNKVRSSFTPTFISMPTHRGVLKKGHSSMSLRREP